MAKRRLAVPRSFDFVAVGPQHFGDKIKNRFFVIDDEHALAETLFCRPNDLCSRFLLFRRRSVRVVDWKFHDKRRAFSRIALDRNRSAVLLNDSIGETKTESSALS